MTISSIVEGHGEVEAVPELLRRVLALAEIYDARVLPAIKAHRSDFADKAKLENYIRLACLDSPDLIVMIFDADDDCPVKAAAFPASIGASCASHVPCWVTAANREYEAWFLASIESLRGCRGIGDDAEWLNSPEDPRDAKGRLSKMMKGSRVYSETADQAALTARMDLVKAHERSRSFRRLIKGIASHLEQAGLLPPTWPFASPQDR